MEEHIEKLEIYKGLFTELSISEKYSEIFAKAYETGEILLAISDNLTNETGRVHEDVLNSLFRIEHAHILRLLIFSEGSNIFNVVHPKSNQAATFNYYSSETYTYAFHFIQY
jgi:hypothetical protein